VEGRVEHGHLRHVRVRTLVVRAREEIVIARAARAAIATRSDTRGAQ